MTLYLITRSAIYHHESGGIYSTLEKAIEAARAFAAGECDNHHVYVVYPYELDQLPGQEAAIPGSDYAPDLGIPVEPEPAFVCSKGGDRDPRKEW